MKFSNFYIDIINDIFGGKENNTHKDGVGRKNIFYEYHFPGRVNPSHSPRLHFVFNFLNKKVLE